MKRRWEIEKIVKRPRRAKQERQKDREQDKVGMKEDIILQKLKQSAECCG